MRLRRRHNFVFQLGKRGEQFAGFEGLDDVGIGAHPAGIFRLERLQFANREQYRDAGGFF